VQEKRKERVAFCCFCRKGVCICKKWPYQKHWGASCASMDFGILQ